MTTQRSGFLPPAPIRMSLNDLECPVQVNVHLQTACLMYVCCGFRSWWCVTGRTYGP